MEYSAPSWSWASKNTPVHFTPCNSTKEGIACPKVSSHEIQLAELENLYGNVTSNRLTVRGRLPYALGVFYHGRLHLTHRIFPKRQACMIEDSLAAMILFQPFKILFFLAQMDYFQPRAWRPVITIISGSRSAPPKDSY